MKVYTSFLVLILLLLPALAVSQDAKEIVKKADEKFNGEKSSYSEMVMTIVRPKYKRNLEFKSWSSGSSQSLTLITAPAKEKGQTFLKNGNNLWSWSPVIQRLIKLPNSMMSQGWMGSDFTNDDIMRESSLIKDFTHKLEGSEIIDNHKCYKILLTPLENAGVVWGKIRLWISADEYLELKSEYYDEDGFLVKTHKAGNIKTFDGRKLPSLMEIIPAEEPQNKTLVNIIAMKFNIPVENDFFTQQNMKKIK